MNLFMTWGLLGAFGSMPAFCFVLFLKLIKMLRFRYNFNMEGMFLLGSILAKLPKILAKIVILSLFLSD